MCGRFSQEAELSEIKLELKVEQLELFREFRPLYNVAPSYGPNNEQAFVLLNGERQRALRQGRWWLIPHFWQQPLKELPTAFNARSEELEQKPFFRDAFKGRGSDPDRLKPQRCLVPATGWREFKSEGEGTRKRKQPYQFRLEQRLFAFAGLWSRWTSPDGEVVDSFTIVTVPPSPTAAQYHDRMPLVVVPELYEAWLDPAANPRELLLEVQSRAASLSLQVFPSNPLGNNVHFEGPEVVAPFDPNSPEALAALEARQAKPGKSRPAAKKSRPAATELAEPVQQSLFGDVAQVVPKKR